MELNDTVASTDQMITSFCPEWVDPTAWIAPNAAVVGEVHLAGNVSVWYGAVLRGDVAPIFVGSRSNVQDGCVIHVDHAMPTVVGEDVVMGHGAIVHAATVQDGCLIAIHASVLSQSVVGAGSIVGAGAVVTEGVVIPPRSLVLGVPGRVVRQVTDEEAARVCELAQRYVSYAEAFSSSWRREGLTSDG
jgi:carbonic anhydrase/acetyltransferase-like protein (isoleucine patch superfamily)